MSPKKISLKKISRKKRLIIPIFIPFGGCTHKCVFCDQAAVTGSSRMPSTNEVEATVESYLATWRGGGPREIAFYGGSFTGLDKEKQTAYLEAAFTFVKAKRIDSLRLSTRPDYISRETVDFLKRYHVRTVELGVQSSSDEVLRLSGRGHSFEDTVRAVGILKDGGVDVGLQLMPGLPGDTVETVMATAEDAAALKPDFVRLYPALVMKNTPLHEMYKRGDYRPWPLDDMVELLGRVMGVFVAAGVKVIRVGLQPTKELEESIVAGPYHPAIRDLVSGI